MTSRTDCAASADQSNRPASHSLVTTPFSTTSGPWLEALVVVLLDVVAVPRTTKAGLVAWLLASAVGRGPTPTPGRRAARARVAYDPDGSVQVGVEPHALAVLLPPAWPGPSS